MISDWAEAQLIREHTHPARHLVSTFFFHSIGTHSTGLSFWLEASNGLAASLSITGVTYGTTFPDPTNTNPNPAPFTSSVGASPGFLTETRDLGSTINDFGNIPGPGTYFVAHITFSLSLSFVPGNYILQSTVTLPHTSEASSFDITTGFADNALPAAQYLISCDSGTYNPEPDYHRGIGRLGVFSSQAARSSVTVWTALTARVSKSNREPRTPSG